jgi:hypothetical protein
MVMTMAELTGTLEKAFSFDAPAVSHSPSVNEPTSSGASVTLSGTNFGYMNLTPTVRIGKSVCTTVSWLSTSTVLCDTPEGYGQALAGTLTVTSLLGTKQSYFTYDAPVLTNILARNLPTSNGGTVTLQGVNFAMENASPTVAIGSSKCGTVAWISDTELTCLPVHYDQGKRKNVKLTLTGTTMTTVVRGFTFDSPVVTSVNRGRSNAAQTGGSSVTILGMNFGSRDFSPTGRVGPTICSTVSWTSGTQIMCQSLARSPSASADSTHVAVDLYTQIGTLMDIFTYDAPVISNKGSSNMPTAGSSVVSTYGQNFASSSFTPTIRMGTSLCTSSAWVSDTEVHCISPTGYGVLHTQAVTLSQVVGTIMQAYTYDAAVPTSLAPGNSPNSAGGILTLGGLNFGSSDLSTSGRIGSTACGTTMWSSGTALVCMVQSGLGHYKSQEATISVAVGTFVGAFTYDSPVISVMKADNSPTSAGASLTIDGTSFGMINPSATVRIGDSRCGTVSWNSVTTVACLQDSRGYSKSYSAAVTISRLVGTAFKVYSFDSPALTQVHPRNLPLSSGSSVTLSGFNFVANDGMTPTVVAGSTSCSTASWTSDTAIRCGIQKGTGAALTFQLLMSEHAPGTLLGGFTYDSPIISQSDVINGPPTGGFTITMHGTNFGYVNLSATARLGYTACLSSIWVSGTRVTCHAPTGVGNARSVGIVIEDVAGSRDSAFSYEPPTPTDSLGTNSPTTGDAFITIRGNNFGLSDTTPSVVMGGTLCHTAYWSSFTSIACSFPSGYGVGLLAKLDLGGNKGTNTNPFTYDSPVLTRIVQSNAPTTGGTSITIYGTNFGGDDNSLSESQVGSTACGTISWTSVSAITCFTSAHGNGLKQSVTVTLGGVGTFVAQFSYDAPVATWARPKNSPHSAGISVTLFGTNFEMMDYTPTMQVGETGCGTTSWTTNTRVQCVAGAGAGRSLPVILSTSDMVATSDAIFTYDAPVVTFNQNIYNVPSTGGSLVTVSGVNFGYINLTPSTKIGKTVCKTTSWTSLTALQCSVPAGYGSDLHVTVSVADNAGTKTYQLTYNAPVTTHMRMRNMPTTSGALITIHGTNFGFEDTTPLPRIGQTRCATTSWNSETTLVCRSPAGLGTKLNSALTVGVVIGTYPETFTYDAAVVTSSMRGNQPNTGTGFVTVSGFNFAAVDTTLSIYVGLTQCSTASWNSQTSLQCYTPVGRDTVSMSVKTVNTQIGTTMKIFTYDTPVVSQLARPNSAQTGQTSITLLGANFAGLDLTVTTNLESTMCLTTSWTTTSLMRCQVSPGSSIAASATLTIGSLIGTSMKAFSYDSPTLTYINRFNAALTGGYSISIIGQNFGLVDYSHSALVGLSNCLTTSWTSVSQIVCQTTSGSGTALNAEMFAGVYVGTGHALFSYDAPIISSVGIYRQTFEYAAVYLATATAAETTDLVVSDGTTTVSVASATYTSVADQVTAIQSATGYSSLLFTVAASGSNFQLTYKNIGAVTTAPTVTGSGSTHTVTVSQAGTGELVLSNTAVTAGTTLTVIGNNFGSFSLSSTISIGSTNCASSEWVSMTSMKCVIAPGTGTLLPVTAVVNTAIGTKGACFSYDTPIISMLDRPNSATSGMVPVTIMGTNLAADDSTPTVMLGSTMCSTTVWTSTSAVTCHSGMGTGRDLSVLLYTANVIGTHWIGFTYDSPAASGNVHINTPTTSGQSVTVSGLNFANTDVTASIRLGAFLCATSSWSSSTTLACHSGVGGGGPVPIVIHTSFENRMTEAVTGTFANAFSYDAPVLTHHQHTNGPVTSGVLLSVHGTNFASDDLTPTVQVSTTSCASTSWTTSSAVRCWTPQGAGAALNLLAIVETVVGTLASVFTFDSAVISYSRSSNSPTTGGASVTISGLGFAFTDFTPTLALRQTTESRSCSTTTWVSGSQVLCHAGSAARQASSSSFIIGGVVGTSLRAFTYDAPTVSQTSRPNAPSSGMAELTVMGLNFVAQDATPEIRIGSTVCLTSVWVTDTAATCHSAGGTGVTKLVALTMDTTIGSAVTSFTFDTPVVSHAHHDNAATSGTTSVTVAGMNFAQMDTTPTSMLGTNACRTTSWASVTALYCVSPISSSPHNKPLVQAIVTENLGCMINMFTFDAGVVSSTNVLNGPTSGAASLTVKGMNFGSSNLSPSFMIHDVVCSSSQWVTETTVICALPPSIGAMRTIQANTASLIGTTTGIFSYDAPTISTSHVTIDGYVTSNGPASGNYDLTLTGTNFGAQQNAAAARVGITECKTTSWRSNTAVVCRTPDGTGTAKTTTATIATLTGTAFAAFTYDSPAITFITRQNSPTSGSASVTMYGFNFGLYAHSGTVRVGQTKCMTTAWFTGTKMLCQVAMGLDAKQSVTIETDMADSIGTGVFAFSYDAPVTSYTATPNGPTSGMAILTVTGTNFGSSNPSATVRLGATACASLVWNSESGMKCMVSPEGAGRALAVQVTQTSMLVHSVDMGYTFDSPVVTFFSIANNVVNAPTSYPFSVTIHGKNFGASNVNPTAYFGNYKCATSGWISDTAMLCGSSGGAGSADAVVDVQSVIGTSLKLFTFDTAVITSISTPNSPSTMGAYVTVHGMNLGLFDLTPSIQIGFTTCITTSWSTSTSVTCTPAQGGGAARAVAMTLYGAVGTGRAGFTYDAPVVTFSSTPNMPTAGGAPLTLTGSNFGAATQTMALYEGENSLRIGHADLANVCAKNGRFGIWTSDTSFLCESSPIGSGAHARLFADMTGSIGTSVLSFTYDAPTLTQLARPNAPPTSGSSITLLGVNFANIDVTASVSLGSSACATVSWSSASSLTCAVMTGTGKGLRTPVIVDSLVGSATGGFTYNPPTVTLVTTDNGPTLGGQTITLDGVNFGGLNTNPIGQIGMTACTVSSYVSATSITCTTSAGVGAGVLAGASVSGNLGGAQKGYTYDGPIISDVIGMNAPATGGKLITLSGGNFGLSNSTPKGIVGDKFCATSVWFSSTSITCVVPTNVGAKQTVGVEIQANFNTKEMSFTYDAPVVTMFSPANGAVMGSVITLLGSNFGVKPAQGSLSTSTKPAVSVGAVPCTSTDWISDSQITCALPSGYGAAKAVAVTVSQTYIPPLALMATMRADQLQQRAAAEFERTVHTAMYKGAFSYDIPVMTRLMPSNGPVFGGASITAMGFNFGTPTPDKTTLMLGSTACEITSWISNNMVVCKQSPGSSLGLTVSLNTDGIAGEFTKGFSYDSPVVTQVIQVNAPTSAGGTIEMFGLNFGPGQNLGQSDLQAKLGVTFCRATQWLSATSVTCVIPEGTGKDRSAAVMYNNNIGDYAPLFSYDSPVVTHMDWTKTAENQGSFSLTINGFNFGMTNASPSVTGAEGYCSTTSWVSDSQLVCRSIMGAGNNLVKVTVSDLVGERLDFFPYETRCPNACHEKLGQGSCTTSGICSCKTDPVTGNLFEGRDCSLSYCSSTPRKLTASVGVVTDHTEVNYWYIPWSRAGSKCTWQILPEGGANFIELKFSKFDLEPGVDFLKVYAKTELIATISGSGIPAPIKTNKGELTLTFDSASAMRTGFAASYTATKCPMGCSASVGHGTCDEATGVCTCNEGWRGDGCDIGYPVLSDSFESAASADSWLEIRGATLSFGCGSVSGKAAVFAGAGARYAVTDYLDLSQGGNLAVALKVGSGPQGCSSNASGASDITGDSLDMGGRRKQSSPTDVTIEYQAENQTTWTLLKSVGPSPYQTLQPHTLDFPDSVKSLGAKVRLRFIQMQHGPGQSDSWAMDDVKIVTPYICPKFNGKECSGNGVCQGTGVCLCNRMFFGTACEEACFINYWHEEVCGCPVPFDMYGDATPAPTV